MSGRLHKDGIVFVQGATEEDSVRILRHVENVSNRNLTPRESALVCQVLEAAHSQVPFEDRVIIRGKKGYKRSLVFSIAVVRVK